MSRKQPIVRLLDFRQLQDLYLEVTPKQFSCFKEVLQ